MSEAPQRQQITPERTPLTLFAPAPPIVFFVLLAGLVSNGPHPLPVSVRGWTGLSEAIADRIVAHLL